MSPTTSRQWNMIYFTAHNCNTLRSAQQEGNGATQAGYGYEFSPLLIHDMRTVPPYDFSSFNLDTSGFAILQDNLVLPQIDSDSSIASHYFAHIRALLLRAFPHYTDILYSGHLRRKRHPGFPSALPSGVEGESHYQQPLTVPHLDYTPTSGAQRLKQLLNGKEHASAVVDRPFDQLNVWRVIKGPNNDWPLALCDYRSVDRDSDALRSRSPGHGNSSTENFFLKNNSAHLWYYVSDQTPDEMIVFRNTCSEGRTEPWAWHTAFDTGDAQDWCRESIELVLFAIL
ncbi:hypothetical protein CB0940_05747 [Cercospora beticola]|uniref:Uncharacterized protein n=1 Tax=Cercospora beticola TaxID=122368 RepID=A0A2G5I0F2_CERBT|nr:hypothetical protein CB0940_05747 [Cercospora beticola]PIA97993.1 hypothetical protein CB0940_05747 [Cercospora beticola]WPA98328.1 hypothetical protein RHO25_002940 [Cercospora beticola]